MIAKESCRSISKSGKSWRAQLPLIILISCSCSGREAELINASREAEDAKTLVEEYRQRAQSTGSSSASEKARMKVLDDLRAQLVSAITAKEEAVAQLAAADEKVKT